MKRKDLALIIVAVFIGGIISLIVSNLFFGPSSHDQKAEKVQAITSDFQKPDDRFFNKDALDPTKTITIEQSANPDPFRGASQ